MIFGQNPGAMNMQPGNMGAMPLQPPMQGVMPMPQPQPAPVASEPQNPMANMGQRLRGNLGPLLQGLGMALASGNPGMGAQYMAQMGQQRQEMAQKAQTQNRTLQWLKSQGRDDLAQAVEAGALPAGEAVKMVYDQKTAASNAVSQETYGVSPQLVRDPKTGKLQWVQFSNQGNIKRADVPDDMEVLTPEEIAAGRARGSAAGKLQGEAKAMLPRVTNAYNETMRVADAVLNDKALDASVGFVDGRLPARNEDIVQFRRNVDRLMARNFLAVRDDLKGAGPITDYEMASAESALQAISTATSEDNFRKAVQDFKGAVARAYAAYQQEAGVTPYSANVQGGGQDIDALLQKYGQ